MKLILMTMAALTAFFVLLIAGFQLVRLLFIELSDFIAEAWHSPEM